MGVYQGMPPTTVEQLLQDETMWTDTVPDFKVTGRGRWRVPFPKDGAGPTMFRVLSPADVPGLSLPAYPIFFDTHPVSDADLGKPGTFKRTVCCLGNARQPDPVTRKWGLTDAGVQECNTIILPRGIPLHSIESEQRALMIVFLYNDNMTPVNELRFWEFKVGTETRGLWTKFDQVKKKSDAEGYKLADGVCIFHYTMQGTFPIWSIDIRRADPSNEYGQRFPFGEEQRHIIRSMAPKFVEQFLPYRDREGVLRQLDISGRSQSVAPMFDGGTGGPGGGLI